MDVHPHNASQVDYDKPLIPPDPRDSLRDPAEVARESNFSLHAVFQRLGSLPADDSARAEMVGEVNGLLADLAVEVRGWYDTAAYRAEADLMVWLLADNPDVLQTAYHRLLASQLGDFLEPRWSVMCMHMVAEFNNRHLPACFGGRGPRNYLAVYPFIRSYEWYYLHPNKRSAMLAEHGRNGRDFMDVCVSTLANFALNDYEWTVSLESDDVSRIVGLMRKQRECEARLHVREETPFFTGKRVDLSQWVELQPHR